MSVNTLNRLIEICESHDVVYKFDGYMFTVADCWSTGKTWQDIDGMTWQEITNVNQLMMALGY